LTPHPSHPHPILQLQLALLQGGFLDLLVVVEVGPFSQLVQSHVQFVMAFRQRPELFVRLQQLPAKPAF
jgi:hypothetical protein